MAFTAKPEILSPRSRRGGKAFDDENLDLLSHVLDDFIRIPGTSIRFGLDGIVGFIPGIGDLIGGLASCIIIVAAWFRGVSYPVLARMVANVGIEVVVGSVPVLGDMFDIAWRANRRNYALLTGAVYEPRKHTAQSWLFLGVLCLVLAALVILPIIVLTWVFAHLLHHAFGTDFHRHFGSF
ncbi:MAG: DUF4112 domain-containing protein [Acidobacteriota bacterium]|nr:DUF4112 domain-containing protein [Acidobacteriota bacterium]